MIGKIFNDRYEIIAKLGAGGTAIVYRARDLLLHRTVTVKILREEYANNADFVRRFRHEAQAVASLSHTNIVGVYDVGCEENMQYIVMEFVEGESLKEYIKRKGALKLNEACNIITQVLAGVQHAHEHGIIHRDIKPHNILLGKDGRAKVTDFGIAVGLTDVTMTYNTTNRIMGSVHYISPEQVQGKAVNERSDLYSAGVMFYEMLTGKLPYNGETPISIAMQHVQGELMSPHEANPEVPMGISYVVTRSMRKNPEMRYESARDMAEAVRAAYQGSQEPELDIDDEIFLEEKKPVSRKPVAPPVRQKRSGSGFTPARAIFLAIAVILLVVIVFVAGKVINHLDNTAGKSEVPAVVGLTVAEAENLITAADLIPEVEYRYSSDVPVDQVISQTPTDGQEISKGRTVTIVVSAGEEKLSMPDLLGSTERIAILKLEGLGLAYHLTPTYSDEFPKGEVMDQYPSPGDPVAEGSTVELVVSQGKEPMDILMPDLLGKTLEEAYDILAEYDITVVEVITDNTSGYPKDQISDQSIPPNTTTQTGGEITLYVSSGIGTGGDHNSAITYQFFVPILSENREAPRHVIMTLTDTTGSRVVFDDIVPPGTELDVPIHVYAPGEIEVTVDGNFAQKEVFD